MFLWKFASSLLQNTHQLLLCPFPTAACLKLCSEDQLGSVVYWGKPKGKMSGGPSENGLMGRYLNASTHKSPEISFIKSSTEGKTSWETQL